MYIGNREKKRGGGLAKKTTTTYLETEVSGSHVVPVTAKVLVDLILILARARL